MDGSHPVRITQEGDHQVVHLPRGVVVAPGSVARREGDRVILEPAPEKPRLEDVLAYLATLEPLGEDERLEPIPRSPPRPFDL